MVVQVSKLGFGVAFRGEEAHPGVTLVPDDA
jgi:hypothetical protein